MRTLRLLPPLLLVLLAACVEPVPPEGPLAASFVTPAFEISDGGHGGNEHFFFLPPLVRKPSFSGVFDPSLEPVVQITRGVDLVAVFIASAVPFEERYEVVWRTAGARLPSGYIYRITVLAEGIELGFAEIELVSRPGNSRPRLVEDPPTIVNGRTLPIRFRIEEGALPVVRPTLMSFVITDPTGSERGDPEGDIYVMLSDGSRTIRLTDDDRLDHSPALSPDASRIAWASRRDAFFHFEDIWVMSVDGTGRQNLTNQTGFIDGDPAWSHDGKRIAFVSDRDAHHIPHGREIYAMNSDGTAQVRLTDNLFWDDLPNWSPDGRIAFRSIRENGSQIYVMDGDGGKQTQVTVSGGTEPAWSPDGAWIAFTDNRDGDLEIFMIRPDGSGLRQLTFNDVIDESPTWSPDGSQIAFHSTRDGDFRVYVMKADGTAAVRLTDGPAPSGQPGWRN